MSAQSSERPDVGSKFPKFELPRDGGETVTLADLKGAKCVVFFYPKDDTKGCTAEAIDFTAQADAFAKAGASIYGVSKDPVAKHDKFVAKHELGVPLLSDAEGDLCEQLGVWVEKSMYGRKYMGIERTTYLLDDKGVIRQVWRKVKVPNHAAEVLKAVEEL